MGAMGTMNQVYKLYHPKSPGKVYKLYRPKSPGKPQGDPHGGVAERRVTFDVENGWCSITVEDWHSSRCSWLPCESHEEIQIPVTGADGCKRFETLNVKTLRIPVDGFRADGFPENGRAVWNALRKKGYVR